MFWIGLLIIPPYGPVILFIAKYSVKNKHQKAIELYRIWAIRSKDNLTSYAINTA